VPTVKNVDRQFHVPVPEVSMPAVEICSEISAQAHRLGKGHIVIWDEDNLQQPTHGGIGIDDRAYIL
jgi:hypothetical protein